MIDLFGFKFRRELKKKQVQEIEYSIRRISGWIERSKEFHELKAESKLMIVDATNNLEWTTKQWKKLS